MTEPAFSSAERSLFSLAQIQHLMRVEVKRAQRYRYSISCLVVTVDRLGHLRDTYGYDAKEEILSAVITMLKATTRGSDFLGRLADDRLLTVVPHTDKEGATAMAQRLLEGAEELGFQGDMGTLRVTLSIGVSYSTEEDTLFYDSMLQSAEEALAEAVSAGGDRYLVKAPYGSAGG